MKIAHVQHPFFPGLGYQENHLPAKQRELGHDARVFASNYVQRDGESTTFEVGLHYHGGVPVRRLEVRGDIRSIGSVGLRGLRKHLREFAPDVIHSHGLYSLYLFQTLSYQLTHDADLFVDVHIDNDNFHVDTIAKWIGFECHRRLLLPVLKKRVKTFLPVNPYAREFLIDELRIPRSNIEMLPLGVDTDVFSRDVDPGDLPARLGIQNGQRVLITAGNLNPTKDLDVLIEAFAGVASDHPDCVLVIVGPGPDSYLREMRELSVNLGLDNRVRFQGEVPHEDLPKFYAMADIGVWPGKLGVTIVEAIGCGLPVVVCDTPATKYLIANDNGVATDRGDVDQLASNLGSLLSDSTRVDELSEKAAEYAESELSWSEIARRSIAIYGRSSK